MASAKSFLSIYGFFTCGRLFLDPFFTVSHAMIGMQQREFSEGKVMDQHPIILIRCGMAVITAGLFYVVLQLSNAFGFGTMTTSGKYGGKNHE